jgi:hypothetical protein
LNHHSIKRKVSPTTIRPNHNVNTALQQLRGLSPHLRQQALVILQESAKAGEGANAVGVAQLLEILRAGENANVGNNEDGKK